MKQSIVLKAVCCIIFLFITACGLGNSSLKAEPTEEELLAQIKEKVAQGVSVDKKDDRGQTSLMWAAGKNSVSIAKYLIENGADVNAKDNNGQTPLIYAAMNNSLTVARLLIASGASINVRDNYTLSAFLWAEVKRHDEMTTLLRKQGGR